MNMQIHDSNHKSSSAVAHYRRAKPVRDKHAKLTQSSKSSKSTHLQNVFEVFVELGRGLLQSLRVRGEGGVAHARHHVDASARHAAQVGGLRQGSRLQLRAQLPGRLQHRLQAALDVGVRVPRPRRLRPVQLEREEITPTLKQLKS